MPAGLLAKHLHDSGTELLQRSEHGGLHRCNCCAVCSLCGSLRDRSWNKAAASTSIPANPRTLTFIRCHAFKSIVSGVRRACGVSYLLGAGVCVKPLRL